MHQKIKSNENKRTFQSKIEVFDTSSKSAIDYELGNCCYEYSEQTLYHVKKSVKTEFKVWCNHYLMKINLFVGCRLKGFPILFLCAITRKLKKVTMFSLREYWKHQFSIVVRLQIHIVVKNLSGIETSLKYCWTRCLLRK